VTLLIGIDGFRPDYLDRGLTPVLSRLAAEGATGPMRPSFPSKTFPNFWTLVTGLTPDRHGIVANRMEDPARPGKSFSMATVDPTWWNAAEPIWVTAEHAGLRTGSVYWPGGAIAWGGVQDPRWDNEVAGGTRPSDWLQYAEGAAADMRVRTVIDWLRRPQAERPRFVALYFDAADIAGHHFGLDSAQLNTALADIDRALGILVAELAARGQPANIVVVSDHGMAPTAPERTIPLDAFIADTDARALEVGPVVSLFPRPGREAATAAAIRRTPLHLRCWAKHAIPARLRYGRHPRVAPFVCVADDGWTVVRTAAAAAMVNKGEHGYDNQLPSMRALFVGHGPAFRRGVRLPVFDNTAVAPLLRRLLGLPAGERLDGNDTALAGAYVRKDR
jgi:predicted AlkP superfamily pyrophosphatase or phosphodiesterase